MNDALLLGVLNRLVDVQKQVQPVLYKGQDVTTAGFDTGPDRQIEDVAIVIARPATPLPPC